MTISHQIVTDADGEPVAAQIPWDQFRVIKAELEVPEDAPISPEWKAELNRRMEEYRKGSVELIPHEEVMASVRATLRELSSSNQDG